MNTKLIPFRDQRKWGFCNEVQRLIVDSVYSYVLPFREKLAFVQKGKKKGYIDLTGKEVVPCIYNELYPIHDGLIRFINEKDLYGYFDTSCQVKIKPEYKEAMDFSEGMAAVSYELLFGKWGYINKSGQLVVEAIYDKASSFKEGMAAIKEGKYWGYINNLGQKTISPQFELACDFSEGLARVKKNNLWGFIDNVGNQILPFKYHWVSDFHNGIACVDYESKIGFMNRNGTLLIQCKYDHAGVYFSDGLVYAKRGNYWGYVDKEGREVIPFRYDYASSFSENLAGIGMGAFKGYINLKGEEIINCKYTEVGPFENGLARVQFKTMHGLEEGYISTKGDQYWRG